VLRHSLIGAALAAILLVTTARSASAARRATTAATHAWRAVWHPAGVLLLRRW